MPRLERPRAGRLASTLFRHPYEKEAPHEWSPQNGLPTRQQGTGIESYSSRITFSSLDNHIHRRRHAIRPFFIRPPQLESTQLGLRYCRRYERGFLHHIEVQERDLA